MYKLNVEKRSVGVARFAGFKIQSKEEKKEKKGEKAMGICEKYYAARDILR